MSSQTMTRPARVRSALARAGTLLAMLLLAATLTLPVEAQRADPGQGFRVSPGTPSLRGGVPGRFSWQEGFGAFSYSHSQLKGVINYIRDQVEHHARKTFRQEYLAFLKKYEVPHDERYIFRPVDEE